MLSPRGRSRSRHTWLYVAGVLVRGSFKLPPSILSIASLKLRKDEGSPGQLCHGGSGSSDTTFLHGDWELAPQEVPPWQQLLGEQLFWVSQPPGLTPGLSKGQVDQPGLYGGSGASSSRSPISGAWKLRAWRVFCVFCSLLALI